MYKYLPSTPKIKHMQDAAPLYRICLPLLAPHLQCEFEEGALIPSGPHQLHITHRVTLGGGAVRHSISTLMHVLQDTHAHIMLQMYLHM